MAKLRSLSLSKDTQNWTLYKYRAGHDMCHTIQNKLSREHGLQDIIPRDKVTLFLEGIRDHRFDAANIAIKDNPVMSEDFESAQARIC